MEQEHQAAAIIRKAGLLMHYRMKWQPAGQPLESLLDLGGLLPRAELIIFPRMEKSLARQSRKNLLDQTYRTEKMSRLFFEEVSEVDRIYPYIWVYLVKGNESYLDIIGNKKPFMEICISEEKEFFFIFYASTIDIKLSLDEWKEIQLQAEVLFPKALRNEEEYQAWQEDERKRIQLEAEEKDK